MSKLFVESAMIDSVEYFNSTLTVTFTSKKAVKPTYVYANVPVAVWNGLITAESAGAFFNENVKKAGYSFSRVN